MKILAIDISGKVYKYDEALYRCIDEQMPSIRDSFIFACPYYFIGKYSTPLRLFSLVPMKYRNSSYTWKRILKIIEGIINYIFVFFYVKKEHIDILHLQWLPFLEFCELENLWLSCIKKVNPKLKIILTMHNIYPHDISDHKKIAYKERISHVTQLIDAWIVHTHDAKERLFQEYDIKKSCIHIIHHGAFAPKIAIPKRQRIDNKIRFLLYANQSLYKGTDLLIEAVELLPNTILNKIDVRIMGNTDKMLYTQYKERANQKNILWVNRFISESDLVQAIQDADVLVFPYRSITQSGALLLGIYFQKPLLVSDLPAFIETLGDEYPKSLFFKSGSNYHLANAITEFVNNPIPFKTIKPILQTLVNNNSWGSAAFKTISLYQHIYDE